MTFLFQKGSQELFGFTDVQCIRRERLFDYIQTVVYDKTVQLYYSSEGKHEFLLFTPLSVYVHRVT